MPKIDEMFASSNRGSSILGFIVGVDLCSKLFPEFGWIYVLQISISIANVESIHILSH